MSDPAAEALISMCVDDVLECFELIEELADSKPAPGNRARAGITCCAEHRWGKKASRVEDGAMDWIRELLAARGYRIEGPAGRRYKSGKLADMVVSFSGFGWWVEAKPIWGDWISDGSNGDRVRDASSSSHNIRQLVSDGRKLAKERPVPGDWWGLIGIVFDWDERLVQEVIDAVGPEWQHRHRRIPDRCSSQDELFGCTPVIFWRNAVPAPT